MYEASNVGVVKINRLPTNFFEELYSIKDLTDFNNLIRNHKYTFQKILADDRLPATTKSFLGDLLAFVDKGKLTENMAVKAIPLLYSMSTRAGGNSQVYWTIFKKQGKRLELIDPRRPDSKYANYILHPHYIAMGTQIFDVLNESGKKVLAEASQKLLGGEVIHCGRIDYRLTHPANNQHTFAIVDIGLGIIGTYEKDVIARQHGIKSHIATTLVNSILYHHSAKIKAKPNNIVIAVPPDYFDRHGFLARSANDILGLKGLFAEKSGITSIHVVPYDDIQVNDIAVSIGIPKGRLLLEQNDLMIVYTTKPMHHGLEKAIRNHLTVVGGEGFSIITDKMANGPVMLVAENESLHAKVIVPQKGPTLKFVEKSQIREMISKAAKELGGRGVVIKLPLPVEHAGKSRPSALFLNPNSPIQLAATARVLSQYFDTGSKTFVTEALAPPYSLHKDLGGLEFRLYHSGKPLPSKHTHIARQRKIR